MTGTALVPVHMPKVKVYAQGKKALSGGPSGSAKLGHRVDREVAHKLRVQMEKPRGVADKAAERRRAATPRKRVDYADDTVYSKDDVVSANVGMGEFGGANAQAEFFRPRLTGTKDKFVFGEDVTNPVQSRIAGRVYNTDQTSPIAKPRSDSPFKRAKAAAKNVVIVRK